MKPIKESSQVIIEKIKLTSPIFNTLTSEQFNMIGNEIVYYDYEKGEDLYHEGSCLRYIYIIVSGIVKQFKTGSEGKSHIIKFARKGDLLGYRSLLSDELACTSARAIENCKIVIINKERFITLLENNTIFTKNILIMACKELGESNTLIADIAQKSVKERLSEVLLLLKKDFGLCNDQTLDIVLSRDELASITGATTESIIRILQELKNEKLIELVGKKIKILNIAGLNKIANVF